MNSDVVQTVLEELQVRLEIEKLSKSLDPEDKKLLEEKLRGHTSVLRTWSEAELITLLEIMLEGKEGCDDQIVDIES